MAAEMKEAAADSRKRVRDPTGAYSDSSDDEGLRQVGAVESLMLDFQAAAEGWECRDCKQKEVSRDPRFTKDRCVLRAELHLMALLAKNKNLSGW
eukprot:11047354-Alexandrium_andersonii.AAC.1